MTQTTLSVHQLSLTYSGGESQVLDRASLSLQQGEIACLLGASGCGKTSLLRCIAGFEMPTSGTIKLGETLAFSESEFLAVEARQIGMVFQDYALFPHLSVRGNIGFGLKNTYRDKSQHVTIIHDVLHLLGLDEHADKYPHQLSGGQQQRVAIGRAIASKPKLLLLDEPFSNLDLHLRERLAHDLRELLKSQNITALMVTHDQQEAFAFADYIGVMHAGKIEQWGCADAIYCQPESNYVANFIGDGVVLDATQASDLNIVANASGVYLLRPEHLQLDEAGKFSATIASVHPQGHSLLLRCAFELSCGQQNIELLMRCSAHSDLAVADVVRFNVA